MSKLNDGGPAFPVNHNKTVDEFLAHSGMTLRDYFAAKALNGLLSQLNDDVGIGPAPDKQLSRLAYWYADAMLAEREKEHTP